MNININKYKQTKNDHIRSVPFIEYDIYRQIIYKLKLFGMNAVFGLKFHLAINETLIVAVASCTAVFVAALPPPPLLKM